MCNKVLYPSRHVLYRSPPDFLLVPGERIAMPGAEPKTHINIGVKKLYMLIEMARQVGDNLAEKFLEILDEECSTII
jgi:hypothetical protein